jgi:hypothetical protein
MKGLAPTGSGACTSACTSEQETANAGTVEALAAALLSLSPADREKLAAILLGQSERNSDRLVTEAPDAG